MDSIGPNTDRCETPHVSHVRGACVCHVERTGTARTSKTGTTPVHSHLVHRTPADVDIIWHGRQYQMQLKGLEGPVLQRHYCRWPQGIRIEASAIGLISATVERILSGKNLS